MIPPSAGDPPASQPPGFASRALDSVGTRLGLSAGFWVSAVIACLVFGIVGILAFRLPPTMFVAALAAAAIVLTWLVAPEVVIIALLLARSSVDGFMELFTLFSGSPLAMNLSGATNSLAVGLGVLTLVRRLARRWSLRRMPGQAHPVEIPVPAAPAQRMHPGVSVAGGAAKGHDASTLLVSAPGRVYLLFLLVCLLSVPGLINAPVGIDGFDLAVAVKEWARLASGLAIFLMVSDAVKDEQGVRRFTVVILASSLIPLAFGWFQAATGTGYFFLGFVGTEYAYRPQGTFAHPGGLGAYLVLLLTFAASLYFSSYSRRIRILLVAWAGLAAGCLALTMARTNWLGMMVAALTLGLLRRRRLAFLTLVVAVMLLAAVPLLRERLLASESVQWRLDLWQAGVQLAWPPTLLGSGLASSPWLVNQLLPKVLSPPHNDYLKALIETGLLGLTAYVAWLVALVCHSWRAYRRADERRIAWRGLALLAGAAAIMVMSLSDNVLGHTAVQWYLWAMIALVPAGRRWAADDSRNQSQQQET